MFRSIGIPELLLLFVIVVPIAIVWGKIFSKAGYSAWLAAALFVPLINLGVIIWFAFAKWPVLSELARLRSSLGVQTSPGSHF